MKAITENLQNSVLFDDTVSYINTSSNHSNIVHKKNATSANNHSKIPLKEDFSRSINNPFLKICTAIKLLESSNYLFVHSQNEAFIFIKPDYYQHVDYYKQHENFSIFDNSRVHTSMHTA